uniref:ABC transporter ATP-binding protein n=1 Tax=Phenylobacterium glaciei TaxID=2803784 RepID=A0A974P3A6_9CAUL|nr:ABC transporter ATP-binding protein [Phenylobacterium glaciei]
MTGWSPQCGGVPGRGPGRDPRRRRRKRLRQEPNLHGADGPVGAQRHGHRLGQVPRDRTAEPEARGPEQDPRLEDDHDLPGPAHGPDPHVRIGEQIAEPLRLHLGMSGDAATKHAKDWLDRVRIPDAARRLRQYPHELSGGMRQRVMIAAAMAGGPALLIADEPTTALDVTVQAEILDLMDELKRETGTAMVLITHDMGSSPASPTGSA